MHAQATEQVWQVPSSTLSANVEHPGWRGELAEDVAHIEGVQL